MAIGVTCGEKGGKKGEKGKKKKKKGKGRGGGRREGKGGEVLVRTAFFLEHVHNVLKKSPHSRPMTHIFFLHINLEFWLNAE